jgi:hypothetical protein
VNRPSLFRFIVLSARYGKVLSSRFGVPAVPKVEPLRTPTLELLISA